MWHLLERVAETHFLDEKKFVAFAAENNLKFGLFQGEVSTWHTNELVDAYIKHIGKQVWLADRTALCNKLIAKNRGIV